MSLVARNILLEKENYRLQVERLEAERGDYLVVLGPSGAGKTLLLRTIAGLEKLRRGEIILDGRRIDHLPPEERGFALVPQDYALWPHMTVLENIVYPQEVRGTPRREAEERAKRLARRLGIEHLLDRKPSTLSSGEQQRAALARALAVKPRVLLLDEPLANLDPGSRQASRRLLSTIHKEEDITVVHVTHNIIDALVLATRVAYLEAGRITCTCTPREFTGTSWARPYLEELEAVKNL